MEETEPSGQETQKPARTSLLTLLCILSFIGSGLMLFSFLMIGLFYGTFAEISQNKAMQLPGADIILGTPPWAFLVTAFCYAMSLLGALYMWRLKKVGFHVYTLAQFFLLFLSSFVIYPASISFGDLLLSLMFVVLYATHLRLMH